jgi:hypothetical protein
LLYRAWWAGNSEPAKKTKIQRHGFLKKRPSIKIITRSQESLNPDTSEEQQAAWYFSERISGKDEGGHFATAPSGNLAGRQGQETGGH